MNQESQVLPLIPDYPHRHQLVAQRMQWSFSWQVFYNLGLWTDWFDWFILWLDRFVLWWFLVPEWIITLLENNHTFREYLDKSNFR